MVGVRVCVYYGCVVWICSVSGVYVVGLSVWHVWCVCTGVVGWWRVVYVYVVGGMCVCVCMRVCECMYMGVCICVGICVYARGLVCGYGYIYIYIYIDVCMCACVCACVYVCMRVFVGMCGMCAHDACVVCVYVGVCVWYVCACVCMCVYVRMCICVCECV